MITYSTNFMGPVNMNWYRKRGLTQVVTKTVKSELVSINKNIPLGSTYEVEEITVSYSGGRIDIRGLPQEEYYDGATEYGLEIMVSEDWSEFSDWLSKFKSIELVDKKSLINLFEQQRDKKIRWANEE